MQLIMKLLYLFFSITILISCSEKKPTYDKWETYGGTNDGARYSSAKIINRENVDQLKIAWEYKTGDATEKSQIQCQPIVVDGVLYATSPQIKLFALDAKTGKELWKFDPFQLLGGQNSWAGTNRGVSYWTDGKGDKRILYSAGNWLFALDAKNGKPIESFADSGKLDLQKSLDYDKEEFFIVSNTPGIIFKDKIIMGMRLSEGLDAAPGHIRAFNVKTGEREWIFHTIPQPGEEGYDTWEKDSYKNVGAANNWAGMALDEEKEIVYVPTGTASYDFWGGYRHGQNLYANNILALDANTGKRIWNFQSVHHDIWDRDFPSSPTLATITKDGKQVDVIAQTSKQGYVYLLDRLTGEPIFPIDEIAVPQSTLEGEKTWPTQPHLKLPEPFMRQVFDESQVNNLTPSYKADILEKIKDKRYGNMWLPPGEKGLVLFPGMDGGAEWGGSSYDQETGNLIVNANVMPWIIDMALNPKYENAGQTIYANNCANCHGIDRKGNSSSFPSLLEIQKKYNYEEVFSIINNGKGAMPAFGHLKKVDRELLVNFLMGIENNEGDKKEVLGDGPKTAKYLMQGYKRLLTEDGYPGIKPPWGTLTAINLNTGKVSWQSVLGEFEELTKKGFSPTGTENYGGPVTTAGGLIFIAATKDEKIRAFDKYNGKLLWEARLPASGHATPAVYEIEGEQYVVIACGGGKGTKSGDSYVAFSL
jgi:quinoprotein glucose dehydrogenase